MEIESCFGEDGSAYMVKGHMDQFEFKAALLKQVDSDDPILTRPISHEWTRVCRDFESGQMVFMEAAQGTKGAFKTTWVRSY